MKWKIIILLIVVLAILIVGYFVYQAITGDESTEKLSPPVWGELSLSDKPLLNTPVRLTMIFESSVEFINVSAQIELPDGFEFVDGNPVWSGDIGIGEERRIEVVVQSTKVGYHQLSGVIKSEEGGVIGGTNIVYVEVTEDDAIIGGKPENNWYWHDEPARGMALFASVNNEQIESELVFSGSPELNQEFSVTYKVTSVGVLPSEKVGIAFGFPPNAFEVIDVKFPQYPVADELQTQPSDTSIGWTGRIGEQQTIELTATFKVISTGWGNIYGTLRSGGEGEIIKLVRDVKLADIYVDKYSGSFSIVENW